ncbi:MAG: methyl-accepting chemotaxis protein [Bacillota bacterium]
MFKLKPKAPCGEALCILDYVEKKLEGKEVQAPGVGYGIHISMLKYFEKLLANEKKMSDSAKNMLGITAALSSFDVNMSHSAMKLIDFSKEMAALSESNLAIVQQTTASMNQVNETVGDTSETLQKLSEASEVLVQRNNSSLSQVKEINEIKNNVMYDADIMSKQIQQLVEMANKVNEIVNDVRDIAEQTNLLALNASIEAARAGEHGKGFSVVAQEIRKLADNTKVSLEGMYSFVKNIHSAAENGKSSMDRTVKSTAEMSKKLDEVTDTITQNVGMLETTIEDVRKINRSMEGIKLATNEINQAMESSSRDAEKLSDMTRIIGEDAEHTAGQAKQISKIDDDLSRLVKEMITALQGGKNTISNQELVQNINKAKEAHIVWMNNLKKITSEMKVYPLQINGHKCAFGHFYHSINVKHPSIKDIWDSIDGVHNELHGSGHAVIEAVREGNTLKAQEYYNKADRLSKEVIAYLDKVSVGIEEQTAKGIQVM